MTMASASIHIGRYLIILKRSAGVEIFYFAGWVPNDFNKRKNGR